MREVIPDWPKIDEIWDRVSEACDGRFDRRICRTNEGFLRSALGLAVSWRFIDDFVFALYLARLLKVSPGEAVQFITSAGGTVGPALESAVEASRTVEDPFVFIERLKQSCDYVCRIDIDGEPAGTGVYLREGVVATAAHVIERLLAKSETGALLLGDEGELVAGAGSADRLRLTFDYALVPGADGVPQQRLGFSVLPHEDWLLWGSSPVFPGVNTDQGDVRDTTTIRFPHGPWDIALIRPAQPLFHIHRYPELVRHLQEQPFPIWVLHHIGGPQAAGQPLGLSQGSIDEQLGRPDVVRLLHDATTEKGASGAPLFDRQWHIVGIHERGPGNPQATGSAAKQVKGPRRNRAVPVTCWRAKLDRPRPRQVPYLEEIDEADTLAGGVERVFGRTETQRRIWQALQPAAEKAAHQRLLVVRGEPGSGHRFTRRLTMEYVRQARQPIVRLDLGNLLGATAGSFVERLLGTLSQDAPQVVPTALTTGLRDSHELLPGLVQGLKDATRRHPLWLVLEGFAGALLDVPDEVSEMIVGVIKELRSIPRLRLVLIGWPAALPAGFHTSIEDLTVPTEDEAIDLLMPPGYDTDSEHVVAVRQIYRSVLESELSGYPAIRRAQELIDEHERRLREGGA
ncbi:serine protease [Actinoplanes sp. OR16]|uniref:trypsin-like peptidase domain-containing protein n=1 Tax=Actinoplanes sp. OR16 TaxID=946334 RepID=UPI00135F18CB|nr:serine protease [Actinoplanes sp. OR16]